MTDYTKTTDFTAKDALSPGDPNKIVSGAGLDTEFDAIAVASASKANTASPTFSGTATFASLKGATGATVTTILDEDTLATDSATAVATQQSIKAYVDANAGGTLAQALTAGNTSGATDLVIDSGQVITTNTISETTAASGVTIDGLLLKDSGVYIGGSVAANFLDDYEEGTFTATLTDKTNNAGQDNSLGYYTKVGNIVHIQIALLLNSVGSMSGDLYIAGIPFAIQAGTAGGSATAGRSSGLSITAGEAVTGEFDVSSPSHLRLHLTDATTGVTPLQHSEVTSATELRMSGSYRTAA